MSNTVQAPESAPFGTPMQTGIGMSPLLQCLLTFLVICPGMFLIGALALSSGQSGAIIAVLGLIPWALGSMWFGLKLVVLLVTGGGINYRRTKAALREGRIGLSYYLRDGMGDNLIVVDEARRLLCLNGDVLGFDDVKRLNWQSVNNKHQLEFSLASGANPLRTVSLGSENDLKSGYERLCNSLGLG